MAALSSILAIAFAPGCANPFADDSSSADAVSEADASGVIDLHPLDIWAQELEGGAVKVTSNGHSVATKMLESPRRLRVLLGEAATYEVHFTAGDAWVPLDLTLVYDGSKIVVKSPGSSPDGGRAGISLADGHAALGSRNVASHDLYLGLRHRWFSAQGRPARPNNAVQLLMDGEEAWRNVHDRLREARSTILTSTWWWDSDFELVRDDPMAPASARKANTILKTLEASPAQKRVLVGQLLGSQSLLSWMTSDSGLRSHVNDPSFQFMREGNDSKGKLHFEVESFRFGDRVKASATGEHVPALEAEEPIASTVPAHEADLTTFLPGVELASVHQKFTVVDGTTAFVGGMNFRQTDWDTSEHKVFDPRRLPFDATPDERDAAANRMCPPTPQDSAPMTCNPSPLAPRKDYILRIDGPAVADAIDVFERRWNSLIDRGASDAPGRAKMGAIEGDRGARGNVPVQITATMPAPYGEHAIAETWFNAVRNAERFIYIEDQYFRMPMLNDAIVKRMDERPDLKLVVVTIPVSKIDPGCAQTRAAYTLFAQRYPDRFQYLLLRSFDAAAGPSNGYVDIDTHAKMLVVDDVFMSVGSANKNNRGLVYEYELNAAVYDRAFVSASRKRMLKNLMPDAAESEDVATWFGQIRQTAAENDRRMKAYQGLGPLEQPSGFFYTLGSPPACTLASVGPDAT